MQLNIKRRNIDETATRAAGDDAVLEAFLSKERRFVLSCAGKVLNRHVAKDSEEELTAMEAFVEAVKAYSYEKGSFLSFAEMVIRRRLIDEIRKENRHASLILMDPGDLALEQDEARAAAAYNEDSLKENVALEILLLGEMLKKYGFSFFDVAEASPKASKTKNACSAAVRCVIGNPFILSEMKASGLLPLKIIEKNTSVPRKILERHRKYIIAATEILSGDYPCLSEYVGYIKRSCKS